MNYNMKFEEQFPSLNGIEENIQCKDISEDIATSMTNLVERTMKATEQSIMEHCLDKEKVKEAINKIENKCMAYGHPIGYFDFSELLKKELGLE